MKVVRSSASRTGRLYPQEYTTVFQAEIYAILACAYEIQSQHRSEKHVSICSDSQAALKALQAARTTSPLVRQCQEALNDISARHVVGLYWIPGRVGVQGNELADRLARGGSALRFAGPEPVLGVSRRVIGQSSSSGYSTNIGLVGATLDIPKDRLES